MAAEEVLPASIGAWFDVPRTPETPPHVIRTEIALVALLLRPFSTATHVQLVNGIAGYAVGHTMGLRAFEMLLRAHLHYWCNMLTEALPGVEQASLELLIVQTLWMDLSEACA